MVQPFPSQQDIVQVVFRLVAINFIITFMLAYAGTFDPIMQATDDSVASLLYGGAMGSFENDSDPCYGNASDVAGCRNYTGGSSEETTEYSWQDKAVNGIKAMTKLLVLIGLSFVVPIVIYNSISSMITNSIIQSLLFVLLIFWQFAIAYQVYRFIVVRGLAQ